MSTANNVVVITYKVKNEAAFTSKINNIYVVTSNAKYIGIYI